MLSKYKLNKNIKSKFVRLVDDKIFENKIYKRDYLLNKLKNSNLDLIEINSNPSIVKIINYNKFIYKLKKKYKKNFNQKDNVKIIRFTININDHDKNFKLKNAKKFFFKKYKIKFIIFLNRKNKKDLVKKFLINIANNLKNYGYIQKSPVFEYNNMYMIMFPLKNPLKPIKKAYTKTNKNNITNKKDITYNKKTINNENKIKN
ncbi:translation initiation factor IF-3 [Candidatus Shikimatogenerans bostrichidophilus]|uniref:translation initiation factor IF-3 n=1 Tax=Candidatus Shikimatogenerans bostrichidophilus TaxID=2943807 RepID=UPI002965F75E